MTAQEVKERALEKNIGILEAKRELRREEIKKQIKSAETVEDLKPIIDTLIDEI